MGVRTVLVEDVSRFAREMKAHVLGIALLRERGVKLLSASDGQNLTEDTDEMTERALPPSITAGSRSLGQAPLA
jgi:DNA invertase Pin-like site-specific DNA recombinase